ncbi:MAG: polysaccharide biosynthesis/export family protein [Acidobacteriota bacterium]|nr:polysaccharide biosynthesis/export family protein [Acidobacteriota bacterium]
MLVWLAVFVFLCCGQTSFAQKPGQTAQQANAKIQELAAFAKVHPPDTMIGSGDLLHIDVFEIPEFSRDVRVTDMGNISFPLIPRPIPVAGLTPYELQSKVEQLLIENGLVSHPHVSVFVREQYSQPVSVVGAVAHPLVYQVMGPSTLLEVLAAAGGISDDAGSIVIVTRPAHDDVPREKSASASTQADPDDQKITIRLQDLLESGNSAYNIAVYGGDTVTVPHAGIVYVLGFGVAQPGGYVLQGHGEQVTVLRAIALAHGLTSFAKENSAVILRNNPVTGRKDEIPVRLKQIEKHTSEDVPLKSNDILYVPDSSGKKALARGAQAALGIGTGVAIYRTP